MTDWVDIPDENLAPDAPVRSSDHIALRDNIKALAEGASGAPKIQIGALAFGLFASNKQTFSTPGTTSWTVPAGVRAVIAVIQGGGGGAGFASSPTNGGSSAAGGVIAPGGLSNVGGTTASATLPTSPFGATISTSHVPLAAYFGGGSGGVASGSSTDSKGSVSAIGGASMWAAGGNGFGNNGALGSGGGGSLPTTAGGAAGACVVALLAVTPGASLTITVGAGGEGNISDGGNGFVSIYW